MSYCSSRKIKRETFRKVSIDKVYDVLDRKSQRSDMLELDKKVYKI